MSTNAPQDEKDTDSWFPKEPETDSEPFEIDPEKVPYERGKLVYRLIEKGISLEHAVRIIDGRKKPYSTDGNWDRIHLRNVNCHNYAVESGNKILHIDIDDPNKNPELIEKLPDTFEVSTPHTVHGERGHLYFHIPDNVDPSRLDNLTDNDWGEIRWNEEYVVGPGSIYNHKYCDDCDKEGTDRYIVRYNRELASLTQEQVDELAEFIAESKVADLTKRFDGDLSNENTDFEELNVELEDVDWDEISPDDVSNELIRKFRDEPHFTQLAFSNLWKILRGDTGTFDFYRDNGYIDRSRCDVQAIIFLTGIHHFFGEDTDTLGPSLKWAYEFYSNVVKEVPHWYIGDRDRKWKRGEDYRKNVIEWVAEHFDPCMWLRWASKRHVEGYDNTNPEHWMSNYTHENQSYGVHDYSALTYKYATVVPEYMAGLKTPEEIRQEDRVPIPNNLTEKIEDLHPIYYGDERIGAILRDPDKPQVGDEPLWQYDEEEGRYTIHPTNSLHVTGGVEDSIRKSTTEGYSIKTTSVTDDNNTTNYTNYMYIPEKAEVEELCALLTDNSEATFSTALKRLRRDGVHKLACVKEGVDYRIVPDGCGDVEDADWMRGEEGRYIPDCNGETAQDIYDEWEYQMYIWINGVRKQLDGWVKRNNGGEIVDTRTDPPTEPKGYRGSMGRV